MPSEHPSSPPPSAGDSSSAEDIEELFSELEDEISESSPPPVPPAAQRPSASPRDSGLPLRNSGLPTPSQPMTRTSKPPSLGSLSSRPAPARASAKPSQRATEPQQAAPRIPPPPRAPVAPHASIATTADEQTARLTAKQIARALQGTTGVPIVVVAGGLPATSPGGHEELRGQRIIEQARSLIKACESELTSNPDPLRAARLHYEMARLYEFPLNDLRRASAHYNEALQRSPEHVPTIRGARRVFVARKNHQGALALFDAEARITSDPRRKAALYLAKGRLLEDVMGQKAEAGEAYRMSLELDRAEPSILKALEQLYLESEAWEPLARVYERSANAVASDARHRAALVVQRARLVETRQRDPEAAIELYETALRLDATAQGALEALKRLHHTQRRWRDLIRVLDLEAQSTRDPSVRTMALYRIGRLHSERLGNQNEAVAALERAASESPNDTLVLAELARLYEAAGRHDALASVLEKLAESSPEADERLNLLQRIGQLQEEELGQEESAARWYEAALGVQPTYIPALQALGNLYTRREQWDALVRMHLAEAENTDEASRRAAAHARVAEILEVNLQRRDEATEHHARALGLVPGYPPSFKALSRLLAEAGRWRELIEVYERAVDEAKESDRVITYLFKIGAIHEDHLQEYAQAAHAYRRVLGLDADNLGAIHALQRATERAGRFQELVDALELEAEKSRDKDQIVALLHRAGEVLDEKLGDRDAALARFRKVLVVNPKYVPALTSLGRMYYRAGRWDDLLDMYKRELELTPDGPAAAALLQKMGELCEERVGRDEEAIGYYRRALEKEPTHGAALRSLSRKLRERGEWAELVRMLEVELTGLRDPSARARAAYRVGEVYEERLGQAERAIAAYELSLKATPDYRPAVDALARLRAEANAWSRLVDDLEREAATTPDPSLAIEALMREGEVWAERLSEPRRAIACYEKVLERSDMHIGALLALEPLYRRVGSWDLLASIYRKQADVLRDPQARAAALFELARLLETRRVGTPEGARAIYEQILDLVPNDSAALEALERLALESGDRVLLADVDGAIAAHAADPAVAAAYATRLAESLEAGADPKALDAYRAALNHDPESLGATRGLSRLAERMDDPRALAEAARREASVAHDSEAAARLLVRSAVVRAERLGDRTGAISDLERALELRPDHAEAADRLSALLREDKQDARLADLLARAAGSAKSPDRIAMLWMEVADIQTTSLDNLAGGIGALNRILRTSPNHIPTLRRLTEYYERDGQWNEAVQLLGRIVQLAPDREVLRDAHLKLAALWDQRLGETSRALVSLQAVLALDAGNHEALARLAEMYEREGKLQQATEAARRLIDASTDAKSRASALVRVARIELQRGQRVAAVDALREAVSLEGPDGEAARACKALSQNATDWQEYEHALEEHLRRASRPEQAGATYLELARVRQEQLGRADDALQTLARGLEVTNGAPVLRMELAERLRSLGRREEGLAQLEQLLYVDLLRAQTWRDIARSFDEIGRPVEARLARIGIAALGDVNEAEHEWLERTPPRPAAAEAGALGSEGLREFLSQSPGFAAAAELLATLEPALSKLYPADLESFGLSIRDRVSPRSGHPLRHLVDRLASMLDAGEVELYLHRVRTRGLAIELTTPPSLIVPASIADLPETQQVFLLARPIIHIAQRLHAVDKLTPRELEVLLASAVRNVNPSYGSGLTSEEFLDEQARRIHRALPRRSRKIMEDNATRYADGARVDFTKLTQTLTQHASRIACVLSDDLTACLEVLRRTDRDLVALEGRDLIRSSDVATDLLRYWISGPARELRRRAGMA